MGDHATWSASATARNWGCPGALALTKDAPDSTSEPADWGTCCHHIAEQCLTRNIDADSFIGQTLTGKKFSFEVDEEMAETAQVYIDYVRARLERAGEAGTLLVEQRFRLDELNPPFDAGGTADAVIYHPKDRHLEVVDLKGGRGVVVEVAGNPQLRTYALGAMLANRKRRVDTITVTIVQPRAPHKDGRSRSETFHVADLVEWSADLLAAMRRSKGALDAYGVQGLTPEWVRDNLKPGDYCRFCPAGFCPALEQKALDDAGVWFDDLGQPRLSNTPDTLSPERAAQLLDAADLISHWINAVRAYWHEQAESGVAIPGYVLVPKTGREKWNDGAEDKVLNLAVKLGLDDAKYLNPARLKTPKQVRKALGKEHEAEIEGLSSTPEAGSNLVRADKTTRQPVAPKAHQFLDILD